MKKELQINHKCNCEDSTGSTKIDCCNICGLPLKEEKWDFTIKSDKPVDYDKLIVDAIKLIKEWHNMGMQGEAAEGIWKIYLNNSPEMKPFREYILKHKLQVTE